MALEALHYNIYCPNGDSGSVTRKLNKILPNLGEKVAQNAKISTSDLNLKDQNIHIKLPLKPHNKPLVETACLGEN